MAWVLNFPPNLTEEELKLKEMFERFRKLKKILHSNSQSQVPAGRIEAEKRKASHMSMEDLEGATEQAKKLAKSGAVTIRKSEEKRAFKRSKLLDRKLKEGESSSSNFQPYNASSSMFGDFIQEEGEIEEPADQPDARSSAKPNLYSNFVSPARNQDFDFGGDTRTSGKTVYIRGYDFMDEVLRSAFQKYGKIVRIHIEDRRKSAFVEYETNEEANRAIKMMNGNMVNGVTLRVSMARRQGNQFQSPSAAAAARAVGAATGPDAIVGKPVEPAHQQAWSQLAGNAKRNDNMKPPEGRSIVTYDDTDIA